MSWIKNSDWPTGFSAPNAVFYGEFPGPVSDVIKRYPFAAWSARFPGVSINVKKAALVSGIELRGAGSTPEVYRSGKFIIPGINSVHLLNVTIKVLDELWKWIEAEEVKSDTVRGSYPDE